MGVLTSIHLTSGLWEQRGGPACPPQRGMSSHSHCPSPATASCPGQVVFMPGLEINHQPEAMTSQRPPRPVLFQEALHPPVPRCTQCPWGKTLEGGAVQEPRLCTCGPCGGSHRTPTRHPNSPSSGPFSPNPLAPQLPASALPSSPPTSPEPSRPCVCPSPQKSAPRPASQLPGHSEPFLGPHGMSSADPALGLPTPLAPPYRGPESPGSGGQGSSLSTWGDLRCTEVTQSRSGGVCCGGAPRASAAAPAAPSGPERGCWRPGQSRVSESRGSGDVWFEERC